MVDNFVQKDGEYAARYFFRLSMPEKVYTIKCHNRRPKRFDQRARCNRVIGQIFGLPDVSLILYCASCHVFMKFEIANKNPKLTPIEKTEMDFTNNLAVEISGYQTKGM